MNPWPPSHKATLPLHQGPRLTLPSVYFIFLLHFLHLFYSSLKNHIQCQEMQWLLWFSLNSMLDILLLKILLDLFFLVLPTNCRCQKMFVDSVKVGIVSNVTFSFSYIAQWLVICCRFKMISNSHWWSHFHGKAMGCLLSTPMAFENNY